MNQPLINFRDYSTTGLLFNGIGCLLWVIVYAVLIREIRRKKFVEMPAYVAGANIGWEFVWSFIYHPNTGLFYTLSYQAAFLLDCYIFYATLRYGTKQPIEPTLMKYFRVYCLINFGFWILTCITYRGEEYDTLNGANSGYIINVILSLQCIFLLLQTKDTAQFSILLALGRGLGTAFISVSLFFFFPQNQFVQILGIACFVLDSVYIYSLWRRHGQWI